MTNLETWHAVVFPETSMPHMAEALRSHPEQNVQDHAITQEVLAHLGPERTVVDIGAGIGRFTIPLAQTGCTVWAVEPSAVMRAQLAQALNISTEPELRVHTVPGVWPAVAVPTVEVALAAFVIHFSPEPREFIRAMEAVATRRCVVAMHVDHMFAGMEDLWKAFHPDRPVPSSPVWRNLDALLWEEGIVPDVQVVDEPLRSDFWRDPHKLLEGLGDLLDLSTEAERAQLATLLRERRAASPDHGVASHHRFAVVSWTPRSA